MRTSGTGSRPPPTAACGCCRPRTPHPEPLVALAGTRRVLESAHKLVGAAWGDEGTTRIQHAWTADPGLIRALAAGQACYIHRGSAVFVQVARPKPSPLSLHAPGHPARPGPPAAAWPDRGAAGADGPPTQPLPVLVPGGLDDVLGPGPGQGGP
jgi:hypothetical protein